MSASTCQHLVELQALRRGTIREIVALSNRRASLMRRVLGFRIDLPEKEREAIRKRADKVIKAILAGETTDAPDSVASLILAFEQGVEPLVEYREKIEDQMRALAERLPVWSWVKEVRGVAALGLAVIIGEAGEAIGDYRSVSGLWKRLGYAVIDGGRQRQCKDKEKAEAHGFSPSRHAECWAFLNDIMLRAQWGAGKDGGPGSPKGPYGAVYGQAKLEYLARDWTPIHAERAARRKMAKAFLADLYGAWRRLDLSAGQERSETHVLAAGGRGETTSRTKSNVEPSLPTNLSAGQMVIEAHGSRAGRRGETIDDAKPTARTSLLTRSSTGQEYNEAHTARAGRRGGTNGTSKPNGDASLPTNTICRPAQHRNPKTSRRQRGGANHETKPRMKTPSPPNPNLPASDISKTR